MHVLQSSAFLSHVSEYDGSKVGSVTEGRWRGVLPSDGSTILSSAVSC